MNRGHKPDPDIYINNHNKATDHFGKCPECQSFNNKIQWGWDGVYYDLICENGHIWTYKFSQQEAS